MLYWAFLFFFGPKGWVCEWPYQLLPSPCVRTAWTRVVIVLASFALSTCLFGLSLIAVISRMLIMIFGVSRSSLRFDDLFSFVSLWSLNLLFIRRFCALLSVGS